MFDERLKLMPVPTPEQTARFADHVADNHSWYKHLPFFPPGASFIFFPNPHAGRGVRAEGGRFAVYDIDRGDYFAHHSRLSTAAYLDQFGHWDYWVDGNPREPDPRPGPWLYDADGGRGLLPDDLKRQWSCRLTAFLRRGLPTFVLSLSELPREADAFMASGRRSLGRRLLGLLGGRRDDDPVVRRYRAVAPALRRAAGTPGDAAVFAFMESEARAQRELVLGTLHRVRAAWADQLPLLRDTFGNPSRAAALDPAWRTEAVVALAASIDAERAFDRLPVLADALEEAGCDHADILNHCRSDGPHVRGCWVVDLVLGKE